MSRIVVTEEARRDLVRLVDSRQLPPSARDRVVRSLRPLVSYPMLGRALGDAWEGYRFVLGPWPWMLLVYRFDEDQDTLLVVTIQDSRTATAATAEP